MDDRMDNDSIRVDAAALPYEAPVLTPIGTLRDLLAGQGSNPCDGGGLMAGPDPFVSPNNCGE